MALDFGLNNLDFQEVVAQAADWLTHKAILYPKQAGQGLSLSGSSAISEAVDESVTLFHYDQISDSVSAEYAETTIRGRSQPYIHYVNTGTNTISFDAKIVAGIEPYAFFDTAQDVYDAVMRLKSWLYPDYGDGNQDTPLVPPPTLVLIAGELYRGVPGIIRSLDVTNMRPWTWNHLPLVVDVSITFEIIYSRPIGRKHLVDNGMTDIGGKALEPSLLDKAAETLEKYDPRTIISEARTGSDINPNSKNTGIVDYLVGLT